jgi:hypothetical protein
VAKIVIFGKIELKTPNSFELGVFIWDVLIGFLLSQARTQLTFKLTLQFAHVSLAFVRQSLPNYDP